jgi:hypothetical protein
MAVTAGRHDCQQILPRRQVPTALARPDRLRGFAQEDGSLFALRTLMSINSLRF